MVEQYPGSGELKGSVYSDQVVSHEKRLHMEPLTAINAVVSAVSQALDLETILQTALKAVLGVVGVDAVAIGLVDECAGELVLQAQHGWQYGLTDTPLRASLTGSTWNSVGTVSTSSALLLRDTDLMRFVPDGLNSDSGSFNFYAWDQTSGTYGTKADVTAIGGSTAFSSVSDTVSITISDVSLPFSENL